MADRRTDSTDTIASSGVSVYKAHEYLPIAMESASTLPKILQHHPNHFVRRRHAAAGPGDEFGRDADGAQTRS